MQEQQLNGLLLNCNTNDDTVITFDDIKTNIVNLIDLNIKLRNQTAFKKEATLNMIGSEYYHKEFATIKIDLGRQTGKTALIKEYLKGDNSIVFVGTIREKNQSYKDYLDKCYVASKYDINPRNIPKTVKYIFIDNASWMDLDVIYRCIANDKRNREFTVVCLG